MKDFDITTLCVKCGYRNASITYKVGKFDPVGRGNISAVAFGEPADSYLLRTCQRCGYKWPERTIDMHEVDR